MELNNWSITSKSILNYAKFTVFLLSIATFLTSSVHIADKANSTSYLLMDLPYTTSRSIIVKHVIVVGPVDNSLCHCDVSHDTHQLYRRVDFVVLFKQRRTLFVYDHNFRGWQWIQKKREFYQIELTMESYKFRNLFGLYSVFIIKFILYL